MKRFILMSMVVLVGLVATTSEATKAQEIAGVKCIVEGDRNANEQFKAAYGDGEVFFCCKRCAASFGAALKTDSTKYQTRANHQLVLTQQYVQKSCPINGTALDTAVLSKVGGVEVAFCCGSCKGKVDDAADLPAKAELVFGQVAFERGFVKAETAQAVDLAEVNCLLQPERKAKETFEADYRSGKVYFCCPSCVKAFEADTSKYAAKANFQLVATGQYVQKSCPVTGGDVDATKTVEVDGQSVGCGCDKCQGKLQSAPAGERLEMVFGDEAFEKSFVSAEAGAKENSNAEEDYSVAPQELPAPGK